MDRFDLRISGSNLIVDDITVRGGATVTQSHTFALSSVTGIDVDGAGASDILNIDATATTLALNGIARLENLNVTGGTVNLNADAGSSASRILALSVSNAASVNLNASQHLASLNISGGGTVKLGAGGGKVLVVTTLNIAGTGTPYAGTLDLTDNDLIVRASTDADAVAMATLIRAYVAAGRTTGDTWLGTGITSSTAAARLDHLTSLGTILNRTSGGSAIHSSFSGETTDANTVLVKYTWDGDADLSGTVDADDYHRIDAGFLARGTTWIQGDFDFDGDVDLVDYQIIDAAYIGQDQTL